jgi:DNA-binding Xre family transcriptional regulator
MHVPCHLVERQAIGLLQLLRFIDAGGNVRVTEFGRFADSGDRELAEMIGLSANAVSELLQEKWVPRLEIIGALCKALHCTPDDILVAEPATTR